MNINDKNKSKDFEFLFNAVLTLETAEECYSFFEDVSRTAVWKGISSLNSDGYRIEAEKGKGYRLLDSGDFLSAERVRLHLPPF